MDSTRSRMETIFNAFSGLSAGNEKALKQGIYNALALFLLFLVCAATYGLYIILNPFVKPLIWALLCGSALFPFKLRLANIVQSWFDETENSPKPVVFIITMIPMRIVDRISETVGSLIHDHFKIVGISLAASSIFYSIYIYTPVFLNSLAFKLVKLFGSFINVCMSACNIYLLVAVTVGYISVLAIYWSPENSSKFRAFTFGIWLMMSLYVSNLFGIYPVLVFVGLQMLCLVGLIYEISTIMEREELKGNRTSLGEAIMIAFMADRKVVSTAIDDKSDNEEIDKFPVDKSVIMNKSESIKTEPTRPSDLPNLKLVGKSMSVDAGAGRSKFGAKQSNVVTPTSGVSISERYFLRKIKAELRMSVDEPGSTVGADKYMYGVTYACIGMLLWKHKWIIQILSIPIVYYLFKRIGRYFGFWEKSITSLSCAVDLAKKWCLERNQALVPPAFRGLYEVAIIVDQKVTQVLRGSVDAVATIAVILALIMFTFCASVFITIQIYAEGTHLIHLTGEILNSTLVNKPDIDWVPVHWEESVNTVLDNAYTYGRTAIADGVKGLVKDLEPAKAEQLQKKVLELWDRLYQAWMMSDNAPDMIGPNVDAAAAFSVWESFRDTFGKMPTQWFNISAMQNFAKENVGILMSVLDSIWSIVKGNMSVILSICTELLWLVFMSSSAVLNFALSTIVFFTTLFYLLSSSGKSYKPIELISAFGPIASANFAAAFQDAIIGVFTATFKLASFFGMWTWFVHNLFEVKFVYLPAVFAAILGAVPFLDVYFACIPATLELFFTRGPITAIIFFLFHFMPYNIVVADFYAEIKGGGHPYLTGLSIAGGIFCLGVQGAILGPLLLCCIMVAMKLSQQYFHSSEDAINSLKSRIDEFETSTKVFD